MYKQWFENLALTALALLMPIKSMLIMVGVLSFTDLILGILAAKKRGELIQSSKMRRTISKLLVYEIAIIFGFLIEKYMMEDLIPVTKILGSLIGITELKSLFENLDEISGDALLKTAVKEIIIKSSVSQTDIKQIEEKNDRN